MKQFRLPGYPLLMITTDLLQEGEDLHTFCSTVHHYGLAWTPSALEQRTGRIDRVRSETERRLTALERFPTGEEKLQVHYPHLADTVERLQARRVLTRMDEFVRLMHSDLAVADRGERYVDISRELITGDVSMPQPSATTLESAFDVRARDLRGRYRALLIDERVATEHLARFKQLSNGLPGLTIVWEPQRSADLILGTVQVSADRVQPFSLQLGWWEDDIVVRCISPLGLVEAGPGLEALALSCAREPLALGVVAVSDETYNVTVEEDVLLERAADDATRVAALVRRVALNADRLEVEHLGGEDLSMADVSARLGRDIHHAR